MRVSKMSLNAAEIQSSPMNPVVRRFSVAPMMDRHYWR
jgi:tRNA-dihydrouridine synthase A